MLSTLNEIHGHDLCKLQKKVVTGASWSTFSWISLKMNSSLMFLIGKMTLNKIPHITHEGA